MDKDDPSGLKKAEAVIEEVTIENMKFAQMLEATAKLVQESARQLSERVNQLGIYTSKLPNLPGNFVFNMGTLSGELDQVVQTMKGYLTSYHKFREVYLVQVKHDKKEDLH